MHSPNGVLADGRKVTQDLYRRLLPEEMEKIKALVGAAAFESGRYQEAVDIFDRLVTADQFMEFLTLVAYEKLE
jgi:malate synthase